MQTNALAKVGIAHPETTLSQRTLLEYYPRRPRAPPPPRAPLVDEERRVVLALYDADKLAKRDSGLGTVP